MRVTLHRVFVSLLVAFIPLAASCSNETSFEFVAADDVGEDPFFDDAASPVPVEFIDLEDGLNDAAEEAENSTEDNTGRNTEARRAAVIDFAEQSGLDVIRPNSSNGVGLYGGTGENVCDVEAIAEFFDSNPQIMLAWATAQNIEPSDVETYLSSLTAGYLLDDYQVVNHTLKNGSAEPFDATLEAGTAVLVDDQGIPRVRCKCGNPLTSQNMTTTISQVEGLWEGDWGQFAMEKQGDRIVVAYTCCSVGGIMLESDDDGVLRGWFKDSTGTGQAEFRPQADGSLDGRWRFGNSGEWSESWDVKRSESEEFPPDLADRLADDNFFADIWQG